VLALPNAGDRRSWEYVGDGLDAHVERLVRVVEGADAPVGVAGSSFGAYASLYAWTLYPHVFTRVLAMSPALWVREERLLDALRGVEPAPGTRVWVDIGGREAQRSQERYHELRALLASTGASVDGRLEPEADHSESAWAARLPDALRFLFG
jgi:predicted alpha/beta superfamily hydrolase